MITICIAVFATVLSSDTDVPDYEVCYRAPRTAITAAFEICERDHYVVQLGGRDHLACEMTKSPDGRTYRLEYTIPR